jgi:DNA-binding CsgD family transcriptional regulator
MTTVTERDERAFKEIKRLCYAGLDSGTLLRREVERLRREVPFDGYAAGTMDPISGLPVSTVCNEVISTSEEARFFLEHIYFDDGVTEYGWMVRNRLPVVRLSEATDGKLERALRHREFNAPLKGFCYELRSVFTVDGSLWGSLCLVREKGDPDFGERELRLIRRLAPHLGAGLKAATLRHQADYEPEDDDVSGVLILDERNRIVQHTPAAERWLHELDGLGSPGSKNWRGDEGLPTAVWSVVMTLRQSLKSGTDRDLSGVPHLCVLGDSGRWLELQASLTEPRPGRPAETVVVISTAGPKEVARLRKSIYGLSPREEEIADLVVRGLSTRQISKTLYISEYTVQDHLKNVFGKVGVNGRRQLVKRLFLDNLPPQMSA